MPSRRDCHALTWGWVKLAAGVDVCVGGRCGCVCAGGGRAGLRARSTHINTLEHSHARMPTHTLPSLCGQNLTPRAHLQLEIVDRLLQVDLDQAAALLLLHPCDVVFDRGRGEGWGNATLASAPMHTTVLPKAHAVCMPTQWATRGSVCSSHPAANSMQGDRTSTKHHCTHL